MISSGVNTRELILEILLQIEEEGEHSHIAIRNALSKYQFLPKQERSFITRVCEGTLEYRIYIDYVIDSFSKVSVNKMKPQIREILRSGVYQLKFMDSVPDSAVCNEAVKLAQRKGFYNLKPFVNGVLRTIARELKNLELPSREENEVRYLSVKYSMPEYLVNKWIDAYGVKTTEKILEDFSYGETAYSAVPYAQGIKKSHCYKSQITGSYCGAGSVSAICTEDFGLQSYSDAGCFSPGTDTGAGCKFHDGGRGCQSEKR